MTSEAREIVAAIFADLRDRRFLKYLFDERPESCGAYGYIEEPLDRSVQGEIADAWAKIIEKALASRPALSPQEKPFGYAYRYPDGIRFDTHGRRINGCPPIETIPLYRAPKLDEGVIAEVKELRELLAKAAEGPWGFDLRYDGGPCHIWAPAERLVMVDGDLVFRGSKEDLADLRDRNAEANAALIVAAVNALPRLLTLIEGGESLSGKGR